MAATTNGLKSYLHLPADSTEDLKLYIDAAKAKAAEAGIPEMSDNAHYELFIYALATFFYDNRGMTFGGSYQSTAEANARRLINSFVLELRYASAGGDTDE